MAIEYRLHIKSQNFEFNLIRNYLTLKNILLKEEILDKTVIFDLYNVEGFIITIYKNNNSYFEYLISKENVIFREWVHSYVICFRLNKDYDYLNAKLNMLDVITYILNHTSEDSILLYSSDVMILVREKNEININNEMGFWNTDEMLSKKKLILLKNK
ncbi:hypothetical protein CLU97_2770 [Chryseobacterium sp. 7]|uniref:SitI3 family protein n=1 Tax=Chryseobacterium sp. 7 TaxID=2035214 RepID=UPI000EB288F6|nr:SitI3 family protein [Chryseobacterium sp. 7]RLJ33289.1 hypothetical protein CLU97_2770 [Chryseobacterium sp. 7]